MVIDLRLWALEPEGLVYFVKIHKKTFYYHLNDHLHRWITIGTNAKRFWYCKFGYHPYHPQI